MEFDQNQLAPCMSAANPLLDIAGSGRDNLHDGGRSIEQDLANVPGLVLIKFHAGLARPVVAEVRHLGGDVLAAAEWRPAPGSPR
jgi:hypothetical protein